MVLLSALSLTALHAQDFEELLDNLITELQTVGEEVFKVKFKGKEVIKEGEEEEEAGTSGEEGITEPAATPKDKPKGVDVVEVSEGNPFAEDKQYDIYPVLDLTDELIDLIVADVKEHLTSSKYDIHKNFANSEWLQKITDAFKNAKYIKLYSKHTLVRAQTQAAAAITRIINELNEQKFLSHNIIQLMYGMSYIDHVKKSPATVDLAFENFNLEGGGSAGEEATASANRDFNIIVSGIPEDDIVFVKTGGMFTLGKRRNIPYFKRHTIKNFTPQMRLLIDDKFLTAPIPADADKKALEGQIRAFLTRYNVPGDAQEIDYHNILENK